MPRRRGCKSSTGPRSSLADLPTAQDKAIVVRDMFDRIAPRYDLVNRIMTFRLDVRWRRATVASLGLQPGSTVADLACGTGDFCRDLAAAKLIPIGVDVSWGMLAHARTDAPLVHADALALPFGDGSIDGITCGFALRNVVDLDAFAAECARVLRPGGRLAILEVDEPANPVFRFGHSIYFGKVVPFIGARLSDSAAYRYLPQSVAYLPETDALLAIFANAGFVDVGRETFTLGVSQLLTGTRAPAGASTS